MPQTLGAGVLPTNRLTNLGGGGLAGADCLAYDGVSGTIRRRGNWRLRGVANQAIPPAMLATRSINGTGLNFNIGGDSSGTVGVTRDSRIGVAGVYAGGGDGGARTLSQGLVPVDILAV